MAQFFKDYKDARAHAEKQVNEIQHPHGIEATSQYGQKGFSVKMVPRDPKSRQGHELRMEVVEPGGFPGYKRKPQPPQQLDLPFGKSEGPLVTLARGIAAVEALCLELRGGRR